MGNSKKGTGKKKETVRPWLVDVAVEQASLAESFTTTNEFDLNRRTK